RAEKEITRIIDLDRAKISIGASAVIGEPLIPRLMKGFSKAHEEIEYDIQISNKHWLMTLLKEGEIDVVIIDEEHIIDPNLEVISIERVPYVLIGRNDYKEIEDAVKDPLITRKNIPNNNDAIVALEEKHKLSFEQKISVIGNLEVIKGMVREGIGNVILPYYAVYKEIETGEFKVIEKVPDVKDGYQIVITKDKKSLIQIIKFINYVQDFRIYH
ncbi:MAG: substrate-binding domain-containing protein, partial [Cetobacterium sp.]